MFKFITDFRLAPFGVKCIEVALQKSKTNQKPWDNNNGLFTIIIADDLLEVRT